MKGPSPIKSEFNNLSEFAAAPPILLVHDPVKAGAFKAMEGIQNPSRIEQDFLFRVQPDTCKYAEQHLYFVDLLRKNVHQVIYLAELLVNEKIYEPAKTNPNQVFTRDSVITLPWLPNGYISAKMKKSLRQPEVSTMKSAVKKLGLREITSLPEDLVLEGGDVIPFSYEGKKILLIGYGQRTQAETLYFLQDALIPRYIDEIIGIELAEWRMNLDGGLVPVTEDIVISDTRSIKSSFLLDANGQKKIDILELLRDLGMKIINVTRKESVFSQACNCICLGGRKIVYYDLCRRVSEILKRHDVEVFHVPGSELVKGRGGPRCMTRPIYKELY